MEMYLALFHRLMPTVQTIKREANELMRNANPSFGSRVQDDCSDFLKRKIADKLNYELPSARVDNRSETNGINSERTTHSLWHSESLGYDKAPSALASKRATGRDEEIPLEDLYVVGSLEVGGGRFQKLPKHDLDYNPSASLKTALHLSRFHRSSANFSNTETYIDHSDRLHSFNPPDNCINDFTLSKRRRTFKSHNNIDEFRPSYR